MRQCRVLSKRRSLCFWVSDPWCQRHSSSGWDDTPGQSWRRSSAPATIHEPGDMWSWWGETRSCCCTSSCVNHSCFCRLQLVEDEFIRCELQTDEQHQSSLHHPHTYSPHQVKYYSVLRTQPDNTLTIVILPLHCIIPIMIAKTSGLKSQIVLTSHRWYSQVLWSQMNWLCGPRLISVQQHTQLQQNHPRIPSNFLNRFQWVSSYHQHFQQEFCIF